MELLSQIWQTIQGYLFPYLEEEHGLLTEKQQQVIKILELVQIDNFSHIYTLRSG